MKKLLFGMIVAVATVFALAGCTFSLNGEVGYDTYSKAEEYTVGARTYAAREIDTISVDWVVGEVKLVESEKETLSLSESGTELAEEMQVCSLIEGTTLKIKFWKSGYKAKAEEEKKRLTLEIPKNISVEIDTVSADIKAETLTVTKADFETVSGDMSVTALSASEAELETTSGDITVTTFSGGKLDLDTTSGDISAGLAVCREAEFKTVSGDVTVNLKGLGATVSYSTVSGDFSGSAHTSSGKNKIFGDGACAVRVDTTSGDLKVN